MKKLRTILTLFVITQFAIIKAEAQPEPVDFKQVENYFLKNDVKLVSGFNCWAIMNLAQYNKLFAPAKTASNKVTPPTFATQTVVAVAMPQTMRTTTVIIDKIEMSGSILQVHCRVVYGENLSYKMQPLTIATVDRMSFIKTIAFYNSDNKLIKAMPAK
ncbi:MAG: hypothetical protein C5B52_03560 [Bacteroidetes bacterium]|nr:MAG: hypothetical protein C5B52_03560 [Bacteroidota bacterium]